MNATEIDRDGRVGVAASVSALRYRDCANAYADLMHALEHHEPIAATEAAFDWWHSLTRLLNR